MVQVGMTEEEYEEIGGKFAKEKKERRHIAGILEPFLKDVELSGPLKQGFRIVNVGGAFTVYNRMYLQDCKTIMSALVPDKSYFVRSGSFASHEHSKPIESLAKYEEITFSVEHSQLGGDLESIVSWYFKEVKIRISLVGNFAKINQEARRLPDGNVYRYFGNATLDSEIARHFSCEKVKEVRFSQVGNGQYKPRIHEYFK